MDSPPDCEPTAAVDDSADEQRLLIADPCRDDAWLSVSAGDAADLAASR